MGKLINISQFPCYCQLLQLQSSMLFFTFPHLSSIRNDNQIHGKRLDFRFLSVIIVDQTGEGT